MSIWPRRTGSFEQKIKGRLLLSDSEKTTLAEIAHRLGRKALTDVAAAARLDTLLRWYRELIAKKFDGSRFRRSAGRLCVDEEIEGLIVRIAKENRSWGYDRIVGAMANLGYKVSDQTVGNILKWHDIPPAERRKKNTSGKTSSALIWRSWWERTSSPWKCSHSKD